ncbi:MAG: hypothetical protein AB1801_04790 [Chloroflexota bacterium]
MMFKLFEFLSKFDLITPTIGVIEDLLNDPTLFQDNSWTFFVPYGRSLTNGWSQRDIESLMKRYGIKTWHHQITNGEYFFSVKLEQAQWAEYLLLRHDIPLNEKFTGAPRSKTVSAHDDSFWFPRDFFGGFFD